MRKESEVVVEVLAVKRAAGSAGELPFPPLLYRRAFSLDAADDPATLIERTFGQNGWRNGWRDTVYDYDHFHTTAHEVLGCFRGEATLQLGGSSGVRCSLTRGDVLLLPAGCSHCKLEERDSFQVVGCYAEGRDYDMRRSEEAGEQDAARVRALPLPARDPLFGAHGPLARYLVQR